MADLNLDTIIYHRHVRTFIQFGGPSLGNVVKYAGKDAQLLAIEGVKVPEIGAVEPMFVHSPDQRGQYSLVGRKISPPNLSDATLKVLEKHGPIPFQLAKKGCAFNLYQPVGKCKDPSDFLYGWDDYVLVYSGALITDKDLGTRSAFSDDANLEDSLTLRLGSVYPVGALAFGQVAAPQIDREVIDVTFGSTVSCGDCGDEDDGTRHIYAVTKTSGAGSPGIPPEVIYSLDGGLTWLEASINGITASATPNFIEVVGNKLVVGVGSDNAMYVATLNDLGAPGLFSKVTSGFVATKTITDIYVAAAHEVYFSALGGYIYKSTDISAGVTVQNNGSATSNDLLRIDGTGDTIVAVGKSSTVVVSSNRGTSFGTTSAAPSSIAVDVTAVAVKSEKQWVVGTGVGRLLVTKNAGLSWIEKVFDNTGTGVIDDVVFVSDEVGWFSHHSSTPTATLYGTWDGGDSWAQDKPRITNWPTFDRANRLAVPMNADVSVAVNMLVVAGLAGDHLDGILLVGYANRL